MKVLFVGGCPPKHLQDKVKEWGSPTDFAGYAFQRALITGLDMYIHDLRIITILWLSTYPKSSKIYLWRESFSHKNSERNEDVFTGFLNLPIFKRFSIFIRTYKEIKKQLKGDEDVFVIKYALSSDNMLPITLLRKKIKKMCLIIPDLPEFMSSRKGIFYRIGKRIDRRLINYSVRHFDCFALLSPCMKNRIPIENKPWIQLEGIYNPAEHNVIPPPKKDVNKKIVCYTGALGLRYGIGDLLEAFHLIDDDNFELWLCGFSDIISLIEKYIAKDNRIKYLGVLDRSLVLALQKQATVLVNPRHKTEEYTKYSFPSKTMEYLASGTPVIMSHLESIPSEYDAYIFYFDDETPKGMSRKIIEVCNMPQKSLDEFGGKASNFILSKKTSEVQAKRLYDFFLK